MDYEKKYKEALERARIWQNHLYDTNDKDYADELNYIFSELKESEDERVRKEIVRFIQMEVEDEIVGNKWLAWLEKQGEQNLIMADSPQLGDQKPTDKIESKFKVGDWVVTDKNNVVQIKAIEDSRYVLENAMKFSVCYVDKCWRKWNIYDAKDGDALVFKNNIGGIIICKSPSDYDTRSYCRLIRDNLINKEESGWNSTLLVPATKEQRDTLFAKMKEAGCMFDFEKKELKKLGQSEVTKMSGQEEIAEIPFGAKDSELQEATYYIPKGFYAEIDNDKVVIKKGEKPTAWSEENGRRIQRISDFIWKNRKGDTDDIYQQEQDVKWLKSLKDRVGCEANCTTTKEWSEEDERNMQNIDSVLFYDRKLPEDTCVKLRNFLKTLKERIGWKPSEEQIKAFEHFVRSIGESGYVSPYENNTKLLYSLLEQLKKL